MKKMKEKNKRLKSENKALCEYVKNLKHPLREEDPFFVLSTSLPKEFVDVAEEVRKRAQCSKEWVEDVFTAAEKFIEDLVRLHSRLLALLNRMEVVDSSWEDVHIY